MSKYTPGPWHYDGDKEIREGKTHIATIGYAYTSEGEPEANARLIAAAPELLAALIALDAAHNHETLCRAKEQARAVIAKAQ
jgi:hypothetical protein